MKHGRNLSLPAQAVMKTQSVILYLHSERVNFGLQTGRYRRKWSSV